ncbi:methyltransferase domain-containing protein [Maribacter sp. ANRC-HE7]|uniref:Methyltransferase domain-containing protein n=1 Tax=Maribacter aquimaris TaxID=2737171 RepID=A0ABR7V5R2_9FLAO|nr:class I SAM-dependent methyltransferase [Maribacter aquimaris]MBD0779996.1 methyltransferase domain-containing protein [Maribacter aquimaris]
MDNQYQETFNTWNKIAQLYEDKFMPMDLYNATYAIFCDSWIKTDSAVLEIGCGPGNITRYLKNHNPNCTVTAIDVSSNMVELAKKNNPDVDFRIMDCRNLQEIENTFDAIICGFTMNYLSKNDCLKLISDCNDLMQPEAILYMSFVPGDYKKSGYITGSTGDRTYFYYHDPKAVINELDKNFISVIHSIEKEYPKSDGTTEIHLIIIAKKGKVL